VIASNRITFFFFPVPGVEEVELDGLAEAAGAGSAESHSIDARETANSM
jgi:hypothetical protein